ncbi:protein of unknown function [Bradyrhizobium vignae]|uniref:Uncharacterized protein n=1 Tax=Bradyrhizobium vignae TaxID=1549949 RepID=A0A2U3PSF4_9BRAD|nr:protein of unknown function [Bradyrhizobium vignae]
MGPSQAPQYGIFIGFPLTALRFLKQQTAVSCRRCRRPDADVGSGLRMRKRRLHNFVRTWAGLAVAGRIP